MKAKHLKRNIRTSTSLGLGVCAALLGSGLLRAQSTDDPGELLTRLNEVQIDPGEVYLLRDAQITRDRVNLYFNRGTIGFFAPVNGEITGAVFSGEGEVLMIPADPVEKRSLARFTGAPILEEQFRLIYMRFTDQSAQELKAKARRPDPDDPNQPTGFAAQWNPIVRRLNPEYSTRMLMDFLGRRDEPSFHTYVEGKELGVFQVEVDERLSEAVRVGAVRRAGGRPFSDVWCSFPSLRSQKDPLGLMTGPARVLSYKLDTRIAIDHSLEGRAELELESRSASDRLLAFELSRLLKASEVRDAAGRALRFFQNQSLEESEVALRGNDWIIVVLPVAHPAGERYRLTFAYQGNVITDVGNGVLKVGERGSWYPNRGISPRAFFDLTFRFPEPLTLVATGDRVEETSEAGWKHSRWVSRVGIPVAGFNLGKYDLRSLRAGGTTLEVYATQEAEEALESRHAATQPAGELILTRPPQGGIPIQVIPKVVEPLAPAALLDRIAEVASDAVQHFESLFGPFPYPRLAISQAPGHFGQGWPALVYLPTLTFLPKSARSDMGLGGKAEELSNDLAVAHEIAHQWWGNSSGWLTYHDQWISEGFSSYAAALHMARGKDGDRRFRELLRVYKQDLLAKTEKGDTIESGGPVWLGQRLTNSLNPDGYANIVYKKSLWAIHMLRALMSDPKTGSDERFFKMLRDFLEAYRGENPSTRDFIRHAEKYMTPEMDIERNHRLDWFFNDWIFGTGVPEYAVDYSVRRLGPKKFVTQGVIEQAGVGRDFEMPVPILLIYESGRKPELNWVPVSESGGRFQFTTTVKPSRLAIDEERILAVVR
ncbi:MAG: M1 family aminopeptidase [Terriglobia bacterium]